MTLTNGTRPPYSSVPSYVTDQNSDEPHCARPEVPDWPLSLMESSSRDAHEHRNRKQDNNYINLCIEAQEALGDELAFACIESPEKISPVLDMLNEFGQRIIWQRELKAALKDIPAHRRNNQAVAYINTFTRHENERKILLGLYPAPNAPLSAIENSNNLNLFSFSLAMRFLAWCKYDLQSDITNLFSALYPNERNQQVVQLRAQKKTLDQIGKKYGLTRERIRQLERKMQRSFNARQARIKIISKINADKNNATIVTSADIAALCPDHLQELLFLLRGCESNKMQKAFDSIIGQGWLHFDSVEGALNHED